ncbi:uncharacterized protein LOC118471364 [Amphiprion ocellaris]|uniref:uncharacterized protein LOC118471364 n=1 Tax=Amphiprion ocellaris TaxID=80972 RepID=UPI0024116908|nr:uncharacterized protein LOC118471364 [Amphiprion ocellaris]
MASSRMSLLSANNSNHVLIHAGSIILAVISQVISDIFFILAKDSSVPNALFQTSHRNMSESFPLEVTMDYWSEYYWIMIDLWSKAWLVDAGVSLCRRNVLGPESCNPEIHPPVFYLMWSTVNVARMCSMSLWDRQCILGAALLRWIPAVYSFYMLHMSYFNLNKHKAWLAINNPRVIPWTQYLTQNGLAVFAWWSFLNAVVGFGIVLKYNAGVPDPLISTIVLTVVTVSIIIWFILQTFLLTKYMGHTNSVYAILILGLGAMFTRSYRLHALTVNTVFCGFLMLLVTLMSLIYLMSACLHTDKSSKPLDMELYQKSDDCATVCQPEGNMKLQK